MRRPVGSALRRWLAGATHEGGPATLDTDARQPSPPLTQAEGGAAARWRDKMASSLHTMALPGEAALEALPLLHVTWPNVTADSWREYLRFVGARAGEGSAGVIALRDTADYICGVMVYEVERDLLEGRVLTVSVFTAVDLANSPVPACKLLDAARATADDFGCAGLQIRLYDGQPGLATQVRDHGFVDRAGYLWASARNA